MNLDPLPASYARIPGDRELHSRQLAYRMMQLRARTQTIVRFTGLSQDRLCVLRRRWGIDQETRHRGPSPTQVHYLLRSPRLRVEAAAASALCFALGVVPPTAQKSLDTFYRPVTATLLCDLYELLQATTQRLELQFEQLVMLALALARQDSLDLRPCEQCGAAILMDRYASGKPRCQFCSK